MVPEPSDEDARAAAALARSIASGGGDVAAALSSAGLLDAALPWVVRVEAAREAGRWGCAAGLSLYGPEPLLVAAVLAGCGETAVSLGVAYARDRVVFGRPLAKMPVQRYAFASVTAGVESAVALVRRVAFFRDSSGGAAELDEAAVLPFALDAAWAAAEAALQVHGGYGYSDEYPISVLWTEVAAARAAYTSSV